MKQLQLCNDFYYVGSIDKDLRVFDIIMETKFGTTYNAYCLKTEQGLILFETVKEKCFEEYLDYINELGGVESIKAIVVNHTEPDHSGSMQKLLALNPNIEVISSMCAARYLQEIANTPFNSHMVKDNDTLSFGNYTLKFISVPNMHWPDTMYTYIEELNVLVTCDSFGSHYAFDDVLLSKIKDRKDYQEAFCYYTNMIMGPFKPFMAKAVEKIKDLPIKLIACGHGPVIDCDIELYIKRYTHFSSTPKPVKHRVVIPYVSAYGYTELMAQTIASVLKENGLDVGLYDMVSADFDTVVNDIKASKAVMYGCPTLLNDALPPIYNVINAIIPSYDGVKVASAFGSYGWSGEAVPNIMVRLKQQRMKLVDDGLRVCFKPSDAQLEQVKTYAQHFADSIQ